MADQERRRETPRDRGHEQHDRQRYRERDRSLEQRVWKRERSRERSRDRKHNREAESSQPPAPGVRVMEAEAQARLRETEEKALHEALVACYCYKDSTGMLKNKDPKFLWDAHSCEKFVWPSVNMVRVHPLYYIGRQKAEKLYNHVLSLEGWPTRILGAKGSGKSTAMAAIAGYLHATRTRRVVYVSGFHFAHTPGEVLRSALLLAFCDDDAIVQRVNAIGCEDLVALGDCVPDDALVVVDEWDKVEEDENALRALENASFEKDSVRICSVNSKEQLAYDTSEKYMDAFHFDGPYTPQELGTWIAHSGLSSERLNMLDYYTGGMPRLANLYSRSQDDKSFLRSAEVKAIVYSARTEIVEHLTDKGLVRDALELVSSHDGMEIPPRLMGRIQLSCFYKEGFRFRVLCPHLRKVVVDAIVAKGVKLDSCEKNKTRKIMAT